MLEMSTFPAPLPVPDPTLLGLLAPRLKLEISIAFSCPFVVDSPSTPGIFRKISLAIRVSSLERQFFSKPASVSRVRGRHVHTSHHSCLLHRRGQVGYQS